MPIRIAGYDLPTIVELCYELTENEELCQILAGVKHKEFIDALPDILPANVIRWCETRGIKTPQQLFDEIKRVEVSYFEILRFEMLRG